MILCLRRMSFHSVSALGSSMGTLTGISGRPFMVGRRVVQWETRETRESRGVVVLVVVRNKI